MNKKRATSVLYLCFSILVAFFNTLAGQPIYFVFCVPFIISICVIDKPAKLFEFVGLVIIAMTILFSMDISIGILVLSITSALFYTITIKKKFAYSYIAFGAVCVFIAAFVNPSVTKSREVYSFMYSAVYIVAASCFYIYVKEVQAKDPKNCPLEQKYIDLIDQLSDVAHESIDTLKKMQEGKL